MVPYVPMLDVPRPVVVFLAHLPAARRRKTGTPRGSRTLGPFRQAVPVLRWFRHRTCVHCLTRDAGTSQATGYRYLHEGIDVLAEHAPNLHEVLDHCREQGLSHVVPDGTLIACDRVAGTTAKGTDLWYSGKAKRFAGNLQFIAAPDGQPLWVSDAEPGSVHDLRAARIHVLPALYAAARQGLPTLTDVGYTGAGQGIHTPFRPHPDIASPLAANTRTHNRLLRGIRALGERAAAELKQRWRALQHVTLSPSRIGAIAQAALVLNNAWNERR
ncbi:transposase family protein [Streptomyces thermoalcalitolerans]|uniref:IS5-like element IS470 family transposase n=1 Tax=Streptomyces thermoalcalitolerans TaxID=65605 RepID=A0ABN1ND08_9ACTN